MYLNHNISHADKSFTRFVIFDSSKVLHVAKVDESATKTWLIKGDGLVSTIILTPTLVCNPDVPPTILFISDCKFGISLIPIEILFKAFAFLWFTVIELLWLLDNND